MTLHRTLGCAALLALALGLAPTAARACDTSQFELAEKQALPRYTLVLFYQPDTKEGDASVATLKKLSAEWSKRANIDFESVDVKTPRGAKIAKYWQLKKFPVAFVIAPTGWSLAKFDGALDEKKVGALMTSPGKAALKDALARKKAAYLVLGAKKLKGYAEAVKAAKDAAKSVKEAMKIDVGTVVVDPADPREATLLQNLGIEKAPAEAAVYVTFGKGRAVLTDVDANDVADRLSFTIQLLATADQCSLGQEIRGEPLLLGK